ncbi:MAG: hypothetical protein IH955_11275 [Chloroflexi bacterium]|nr:hypothetical protein [Chloroflexota bacterium]
MEWLSKGVMRGILILGAVLVIALACGGDAVATPQGPRPSPTVGQIPLALPTTVTPAPTATATTSPTDTPAPTAVPIPVSTTPAPGVLTAGLLDLPAASAFGEPGFHRVLTASADVPRDPAPGPGSRLVLKLWDADNPKGICSFDHPLSGCATVDWSDDDRRPGVPPGGVFENSLTLELTSGEQTFFLSQSDTLSDEPDPFAPG